MTLIRLMTNEIIVSRLETVSGNRTSYISTITLDVCIQRMSEERSIAVGGAVGKMFRMYTKENANILVGDKLVDTSSGYEYKVVAITEPAQLGNFVHFECLIEKVK